jgi:hypothetical protein
MLKVLGLCIFSISLLGSIHIDIVRDESAGVCPAPLCAVQNVCLPMTFNPIMSDSLFCYDLVAEQASLEDQAGQARYGAQLIMAVSAHCSLLCCVF